jgi:hypothetical protein
MFSCRTTVGGTARTTMVVLLNNGSSTAASTSHFECQGQPCPQRFWR